MDRLPSRRRAVARALDSAWSALVVLMLSAGGCSEQDAADRPHIIVFTLDTLRADRLGAYGHTAAGATTSPFIDRLADEGLLFERCYAPRGMTQPSLASMLTGKYPATHGLRGNGLRMSAEHVPFPVLLKREGYRTAGFCSNLDLTRWPFWVRGLDVAEDGIDGALEQEGFAEAFRFERIWDERTTSKALRWIEALPHGAAGASGDSREHGPIFLWVHLYDVHAPYTPAEETAARLCDPTYEGALRHPTGAPGEARRDVISDVLRDWTLGRSKMSPQDLAHARALYDGGILECDERLERIASALDEKGIWDDALVLFTSDHGDELGDHDDYFFHGNSIYDSTLHIPLLLRWPGRIAAGRRTDALAQILDLSPTILEAADAPIPAENEGVSLLPLALDPATSPPRPLVFAEWEDLIFAVSDGEWKYIHNPRGCRPTFQPYNHQPGTGFPYQCFELYNVAVDPLEQTNLYRPDHPRARALELELKRFLSDPRHRQAMVLPGSVDPGLAALGYVGTTRNRQVITIECGEHGEDR